MAFEDQVITKFTADPGKLLVDLGRIQTALGKTVGAVGKVTNAANKTRQASDKMATGFRKTAASGMATGRTFEHLEKQIGRVDRGFRRAAISLTTGSKAIDMLATRFDRASLMMWKFTMAAIPMREMMMQATVVTGVGIMAIKKLADEATLIDSTRRAFEKMTGSMETAGKMVEYLRDQAPKIRYSLTQVIEAGRVLTVAGYDVTALIHPMGDLAAAINQDGVDIASASRAFVDAMHGEFRRLRNTFDITKEEVREFAGDAINAQGQVVDKAKMQWALMETIQRKYGGANEAMMGTLIGSVSNFNDQLKRLGATLGGFLTPALKSVLAWGAKFIGRLNEMAKTTGAATVWTLIIGTAVAGFVALGAAIANVAIQFMGVWSSFKIFQQTFTTGQKMMIEIELELAKVSQMLALQEAVEAAELIGWNAKKVASIKAVLAAKMEELGFAGMATGGAAATAVAGVHTIRRPPVADTSATRQPPTTHPYTYTAGDGAGPLSRQANALGRIKELQSGVAATQRLRVRLAAELADMEYRAARGFRNHQLDAEVAKRQVFLQKTIVREAKQRLELSRKQLSVDGAIAVAIHKQRQARRQEILDAVATGGGARGATRAGRGAPVNVFAPLQRAATFLGQRFAHTGRQLAMFGQRITTAASATLGLVGSALKSVASFALMNIQFAVMGAAIAGISYLLNTSERRFDALNKSISAAVEKFKEMADVVPVSDVTKQASEEIGKFSDLIAQYGKKFTGSFTPHARPYEWAREEGLSEGDAVAFARHFWKQAGETSWERLSPEQQRYVEKNPQFAPEAVKHGRRAETASAEEIKAMGMPAQAGGFGQELLNDMQADIAKRQAELQGMTIEQYERVTQEAKKHLDAVEMLKKQYDAMSPGRERDVVLGRLRNSMLLDASTTEKDVVDTASDLLSASKDSLDVGKVWRSHLESQGKLRKDELVSVNAMEKAIEDSKKQGGDMLLTLLRQQDALDAGKKKYEEYKTVQDALIAAQPARTRELNKQTEEQKEQLEIAQALLDVGMAQLRIEELKSEQQVYEAGGGKYAGLVFGQENIDEQWKLYTAAHKKKMETAQKEIDAAKKAVLENPSASNRKDLANAQAAYKRSSQQLSPDEREAVTAAYKAQDAMGTARTAVQLGGAELGPSATTMEKVANSYVKVGIMEDALTRQKAMNERNIQAMKKQGANADAVAWSQAINSAEELQEQNKIDAENQNAQTESMKFYIDALKAGRSLREVEGANIKELLDYDIAILENEKKLAEVQGDRIAMANAEVAIKKAKEDAYDADVGLREQGFKILQTKEEMGFGEEGVVDRLKKKWADFYLWRSQQSDRSAKEQMDDYEKYLGMMKDDTETEWGKIIGKVVGAPQAMMEQALHEAGMFRQLGTGILGGGLGAKEMRATLAGQKNNEVMVRVKFEDLAPAMIQGKVAAAMPALMNQFGRELVGVLNA